MATRKKRTTAKRTNKKVKRVKAEKNLEIQKVCFWPLAASRFPDILMI